MGPHRGTRSAWAPSQFHIWFSTFPCPGSKFPGWPAQPVVGQGLPVPTILPHSHCPTTPDQFSAPVLVNMSSILYVTLPPLGWEGETSSREGILGGKTRGLQVYRGAIMSPRHDLQRTDGNVIRSTRGQCSKRKGDASPQN